MLQLFLSHKESVTEAVYVLVGPVQALAKIVEGGERKDVERQRVIGRL